MTTDLDKSIISQESSTLIDRKAMSPVVITGLARILDASVIAISSLVIFLAYVTPVSMYQQSGYIFITLLTVPLAVFLFQALHLYSVQSLNNLVYQFSRVTVSWTLLFGVLLLVAFMSKSSDIFSRVWFVAWFVAGLVSLLSIRFLFYYLVRGWAKNGQLTRHAIIVGGGQAGQDVIRRLTASKNTDIKIVGIFDDRSPERLGKEIPGFPIMGNVNELVEFGRNNRVDLLIVTLPLTAEGRLQEIFKKLWVLPVDIRLSAHTQKLNFRPRSYSFIGDTPMIDVYDKPIADWDSVIKNVFDKIVASLALVFLSPLMFLTALAVKLESRGPVFFKQKRYGFNNELIEVYKFRSMYTDMSDATAAKLVTKDDPRVTRVGRIIRKTSLDELPQLFNVLKGELSLVGPRPHAVQAKAADQLYDEAVDGYFARHKVKPGITGWAQINGWRGETDTKEKILQRVEHDLYYIENWSIFLDLVILLRTPTSLLETKNAY